MAGLIRVGVPGVEAPPEVTVILADLLALPSKAVIVATVVEETGNVVTGKVTEVWPSGTVVAPGARATEKLLVERVTDAPPPGAGLFRRTVPVALVPPGTVLGLMLTDPSKGGAFGSGPTYMKNDLVTPPAVAVMFTGVDVVTGLVVIVKLLAVFPPAIETVAGT